MHRSMLAVVASLVVVTLFASTIVDAAPNCANGHCVYIPLTRSDSPGTVALVGQTFTYTDIIDYLHIIGEIRNTTATPVWLIKITANIFDSQQHLVANAYTFAYLDHLPPNSTTCFNVQLKAPVDIGTIEFEKPIYSISTAVTPQLSVINDSGAFDPTFRDYKVIGQVRNDDTVKVTFVSVVGTIYNAAGQAIGCNFTYVNSTDLDAGQSSSFTLRTIGRDYSDATTYTLQATGNRE